MRGYTAQTRFIAGELSPRMHMQFDSDYYPYGAKKISNMVVTQQGTLKRRQATEFIQSYGGSYARVLPFQLSPNSTAGNPFPVVVSDNGSLYIEGSFGTALGSILNVNHTFDLGATGWTTTGAGNINFLTGYVEITAATTVGQDRFVYQSINFTEAGEYLIKLGVSTDEFLSPQYQAIVGTTAGASDISVEYYDGEFVKFTIAAPATLYVGFKVLGGQYVEFEEGVSFGTQDITFTEVIVRKRNVSTGSSSVTHPYSSEDIKNLYYTMVPSRNAMFLVTPKKAPMVLEYNSTTSTWTFNVITFTSQPSSWSTGNYPRCVCFFQGRSWWAGVTSKPETVWGSKSLVFENLTLGANADDAIEFTNSAKGRIEWMAGVRNLLVGTEFGEYAVTSQTGVLQPSDLAIEPQSADGGCSVMPLPIGSAAMFVSADFKKIRTAQYNDTDAAWVTRDVTAQADHLFTSGVVEACFARNPDSLMWCVTGDGKLASATVTSFAQPFAWHSHDIGNRAISACVLQENGTSNIYLVTYRSGELSLERMTTGPALDSRVAKVETTEFDTVEGLAHLLNMSVDVQADGFYYESVPVSNTGVLTLPVPCKEAYIGIPFVSELQPLRKDIQLGAGSTASLKKSSGFVDVWVLDSIRPTVNDVKVLNKTPEVLMNLPAPAFTGMASYSLTGYNEGDISIKSIGPYPLEICGVFTKTEGSTL